MYSIVQRMNVPSFVEIFTQLFHQTDNTHKKIILVYSNKSAGLVLKPKYEAELKKISTFILFLVSKHGFIGWRR